MEVDCFHSLVNGLGISLMSLLVIIICTVSTEKEFTINMSPNSRTNDLTHQAIVPNTKSWSLKTNLSAAGTLYCNQRGNLFLTDVSPAVVKVLLTFIYLSLRSMILRSQQLGADSVRHLTLQYVSVYQFYFMQQGLVTTLFSSYMVRHA